MIITFFHRFSSLYNTLHSFITLYTMKISQRISEILHTIYETKDFADVVKCPKAFFKIHRTEKGYIFNGLMGLHKRLAKAGFGSCSVGVLGTMFEDKIRTLNCTPTSPPWMNIVRTLLITHTKKSMVFELSDESLVYCVNGLNTDGVVVSNQCDSEGKELVKKVVVDFSSPNIAKDMHVGHLRSTIIGDSICKVFEAHGYEVLRTNHIGDFGLPFGMVIQHIIDNDMDVNDLTISDLQKVYTDSKTVYDLNKRFNRDAHDQVSKLQTGDGKVTEMWKSIRSTSLVACHGIYERLDVKLTDQGESFYRDIIPDMLQKLETNGFITHENGAKIINVDGFKFPLIVVKGDGAYTYDTTDLAAIWYRLMVLNATDIYYVVDTGQKKHFELVFAVARKAGWLTHQTVKHIEFGLVQGEDGKRIKSRDGGTVKLESLLDESVTKTTLVMKEKNPDGSYPKESITNIALSAVKYADLSTTRTSNYKFSFNRMLEFEGNTAIYLLYAYTRIQSIIRKCSSHIVDEEYTNPLVLESDHQRNICRMISQLEDVMDQTLDTMMFHTMCDYLYHIAKSFHSLYKNCRVLQYDKDGETVLSVNYGILKTFTSIEKVMKYGFNILGMKTIDRM